MKSLSLTFLLAALIFVWGCGKTEIVPATMGTPNVYKNPAYGYSLEYPERWKQLGDIDKSLLTESQEMANKFIDPMTGIEGGRVLVEVFPHTEMDLRQALDAGKSVLEQTNAEISPETEVMVGDTTAIKIPYSIQATSKSKIFGYEIYVPGDTATYKITVEGYGDQYQAYAGVFDTMVASFKLPIVVAKLPDVWQASPNMSSLDTKFFTLPYPENMEFVDVKKGDKDYVVELKADRQDVTLHIDVFGAVGLTVDKVWEQNKGRYRSRGTGETTIDGQKTFWVDYSPMSQVSSRAYFTVKNDKVIRTTLNWFAPKKGEYFPVLEGMVKSRKLK